MKNTLIPLLTLAGVTAAPVGAQVPETSKWRGRAPWFEDISEEVGADFEHEDGAFSYAMGSGVAWIDLEGDGDEDLLLLSALGGGTTLRNDGGEFVDVSASSGPFFLPGDEPIGVACADYDQDGLTDAYYCNVLENRLYRNNGGVFEDVSLALGVGGGQAWSTSASWADWDMDGDLDLYVGNYVRILNFPYHYGAPNVLLENRGPAATPQFANVAEALGVDDTGIFGPPLEGYPFVSPEGQPTAGCTLSTGTLDYDEDGDPDLMVGNDFGQWVVTNKLFRNDQSGNGMAFTDVTSATGFDTRPHYNMGIVPCDYDHDGDWDFYNSNLGDNLLLRNEGGVFVDATYEAGPVSGWNGELFITSWGMIWQDLDNDGWEDLIVANGYIPSATFIANEKRSANDLWINRGDGTFLKIHDQISGIRDEGAGRAIAQTDLDGDGLLDFYLQNNGANQVAINSDRSRLYRNQGPSKGAWIQLKAAGRLSNLEGIGTRIDVTADGTTWKRQVLADPVYLAAPSRVVHVGLGPVASIDRVDVFWPSGVQQAWLDVEVDQRMDLIEPVVTLESIDPLAYSPGVLTVAATVQNRDAVAHDVLVEAAVLTPAGETLALLSSQWNVAPGVTEVVPIDHAVDPALYALVQGGAVDVRIGVRAAGALDEEQVTSVLP